MSRKQPDLYRNSDARVSTWNSWKLGNKFIQCFLKMIKRKACLDAKKEKKHDHCSPIEEQVG